MLLWAKKRSIWHFLKISALLDFVTKLILKTKKKSPRKYQQGGNLEDKLFPRMYKKLTFSV